MTNNRKTKQHMIPLIRRKSYYTHDYSRSAKANKIILRLEAEILIRLSQHSYLEISLDVLYWVIID